jgi:hypothetical protein
LLSINSGQKLSNNNTTAIHSPVAGACAETDGRKKQTQQRRRDRLYSETDYLLTTTTNGVVLLTMTVDENTDKAILRSPWSCGSI